MTLSPPHPQAFRREPLRRAIWLSAILAAIFALCVGGRAAAKGPNYFLELHATSSVTAHMQLFFDVGRGINEGDSSVASLPAGVDTLVQLPLQAFNNTSLRLDPLDRPGKITLSGLRICAERDTLAVLTVEDMTPNADVAVLQRIPGGGLLVETTPQGNDSSLSIRLPGPISWHSRRVALWIGLRTALWTLLFGWPAGLVALLAFARLRQRRTQPAAVGPRFAAWTALHPSRTLILVALAATVLSCYPVIFFGKSFVSPGNGPITLVYETDATISAQSVRAENAHGADSWAAMVVSVPYSMMQHRALFEFHEWPLWNRYTDCGIPLLAQGISTLFDPLHWPAILTDSAPWAWDAQFLVARFLFFLGMGLLVHALTRSLPAAAAVATTAAFLGFFFFRVNHPAIFALCYSSWLLLPFVKIQLAASFRGRTLWAMVLILAATCEMNSGVAKESYMLLATLFFVGLGGSLVHWRRTRAPFQAAAVVVAALLLLVVINSPTLLQFARNMVPPRGFTIYDAPRAKQLPPSRLANYFEDIFTLCNPDQTVLIPSVNFMVLLGALWALARFGALWRKTWFLAALLGALSALALAFSVVPESWIIQVPILRNVLHVHNTFCVVAIPLVLTVAGFGYADFFTRLHMSRRQLLGTLRSVIFMTLAIVALNVAAFHDVEHSTFFYVYLWLVLAAVFLTPLVFWYLARHPRNIPALGALAFCLVIPHIRHGAHLESPFDAYVFNPSARVPLHFTSPAIERLAAPGEDPHRVAAFASTLVSGFRAALALESDDGPDAIMNGWYRQLELPIGIYNDWRLALTPQTLLTNRNIYDMLNRRYYAAMPGSTPPTDGLVKVFDGDLVLYESPTAWPRAFFSDRATSYAAVQDFVDLVRQGDGQPLAAIQKNDPEATSRTRSIPTAGSRTTVPATAYRLTNNITSFDIAAPGPGVVVLSETYFDQDFLVSINGQPAPYFRVNQAFKGLTVPAAGNYHITFEYWPKYFTATLLAAGGTALIALAWLIAACVIAVAPRPKPGAH